MAKPIVWLVVTYAEKVIIRRKGLEVSFHLCLFSVHCFAPTLKFFSVVSMSLLDARHMLTVKGSVCRRNEAKASPKHISGFALIRKAV